MHELRHDLDRLVPHAQIGERAGVHEEHLGLRFAGQVLGVVGQRDVDRLLGLFEPTLAIRHERQVIQVAVHAERRAELAQRELVVAVAVGHHRERLAGEIDARRLLGHPLGVLERRLRVVGLKRVRGQDVQADVLGMLLRQSAQTFALVLAQHVPFQTLGHDRLTRTTVGVRVLRGEADRAIGVLARLRHVFTALVVMVVEAVPTTVVTAEIPAVPTAVVMMVVAAVITAVIATEVPAVAITVEVTAFAVTAVITTEVPAVATVEITALAVAVVVAIPAVARTIAARSVRLAVAVETLAAFVVLMELTAFAVAVEVAVAVLGAAAVERSAALALALAVALALAGIVRPVPAVRPV